MTALNPRELRTAFGRFMTGVAVVTTRAPDGAPPGLGYVGGRYFSLGLERAALENTGGSTVCGALIEQDGGLLLEQTPHGYRVPQIILSDWSNLRGSLADGLRARGIQAEIGQAYSVFDDRDSGRHCVFFLAAGAARPGHDELRIIPFSDLPGLTCAQPTTARMLTRYALEARDIHSLPERT